MAQRQHLFASIQLQSRAAELLCNISVWPFLLCSAKARNKFHWYIRRYFSCSVLKTLFSTKLSQRGLKFCSIIINQRSIVDRYLFCSSVEVRVQVLVLGMFSSRYTCTKSEHMVKDLGSRSKMICGGHHKCESNH